MPRARLSRRRVLVRATSGSAALAAGTLAARGAVSANDRLSIGVVGCGDRGSALMGQIHALAKQHNARITAVCDVWRVNLERTAERVQSWFGAAPAKFTRFGDLMGTASVDAVVIATPDFGHTPILLAALRAGKDAYVEKPMAMEVGPAGEALALARKDERVVQVGTQRRSEGAFIAAAREVATGVLGPINRVTASVNFNHPRWRRAYADCKQRDVDWDAYLFNRPPRPFDPKQLRRWHLYRDFTNGLSGLWMSHYVDAVHMLTGASYPARAAALGGNYVWKDGREHSDTFHALLEYPEGFLMDWAMSLGNAAGKHFSLHGTQGTLDAEKGTISTVGGASGSKVPTKRIKADPNQSHMGNWLTCLRSRKRPNADIAYGHQHAVATIMTAAALHTGRRQCFDRDTSQVRAG